MKMFRHAFRAMMHLRPSVAGVAGIAGIAGIGSIVGSGTVKAAGLPVVSLVHDSALGRTCDDDEVDRWLDSLAGQMRRSVLQMECASGQLCRWEFPKGDPSTMRRDWSKAMFRAIARGNQRMVDTLTMNVQLAQKFDVDHVVAAIHAGLDIRGLFYYGVPYSVAELRSIENPVIKQGLLACVRVGPSSEEMMRLLLNGRVLVKTGRTDLDGKIKFADMLKVAACLVPEVMNFIVDGVRAGDDYCMSLFATVGDLLCDGGRTYMALLLRERSCPVASGASGASEKLHRHRMTSQPAESCMWHPYWKPCFVFLDNNNSDSCGKKPGQEVSLFGRMRRFARCVRGSCAMTKETDRGLLQELLCEQEDGEDAPLSASLALCAAVEADNMYMLQMLVEEFGVPPSRGPLVVACRGHRKAALKYLLARPEYSVLL